MLVVDPSTEEYMASVLAFAQERGVREQFEETLLYLHLYACTWDRLWLCRVTLFKDFSPNSFSLIWARPREITGSRVMDYDFWFNGGLVWHPPAGEPDESRSVILESAGPKGRWQVHT